MVRRTTRSWWYRLTNLALLINVEAKIVYYVVPIMLFTLPPIFAHYVFGVQSVTGYVAGVFVGILIAAVAHNWDHNTRRDNT